MTYNILCLKEKRAFSHYIAKARQSDHIGPVRLQLTYISKQQGLQINLTQVGPQYRSIL